jgi:hypothetical protein
MRNIALFCAVLIGMHSEHLMGSELLIWGLNSEGVTKKTVIHVPQTEGDGATYVKVCPTGLNYLSFEKLGAVILNQDQTIVAVGQISSHLVPPPGLKDVIDVATGFNHAIALTRSGSIVVWGEGFFATNNVPSGLSNTVGVAAGMETCLALSSNGMITCWNRGKIGQQWKGASNVVAVSLSQGFFNGNGMALKRDGTVLQWHRQTMASPVAGISNIVAISASPSHCLALTTDAKVKSWLSNGAADTTLPPGLTNVIAIAAGYEYVGAEASTGFSLALRKDGTVSGWRQMGGGGNIVPPGISDIVAIAAGDTFCMAITTNKAVAERFMQNGK